LRTPARDALLVALAAVVLHARTVAFGFVGLDDRDLVVDDQPFLSQASSVWRAFGRAYMSVVDVGHAYYRPLVTASYALDARWSGVHAAGYHATNVALHAATCAVVWALLRRLSLGREASLVASLLFAVHPVLSSTVAWIPGRNDSLLALFVVGSWLAFLHGRRTAHLLLFTLALLTKETAIALPVVCAAHALLLEPELRRPRVLGLHGAAWLLLIGTRLALHPAGSWTSAASLDQLPQLAAGLGKLVMYLRPTAVAVAADIPVWPGLVGAAGLVAATATVPGIRRRVMALGAVAIGAFLLPPVLLTGTLVLDQRLYLPAVGVVLMVGEILRALAPERRLLGAFAGVALVGLGLLTFAFEDAYRDRRSFAREAVSGSPRSALAHLCLGQSDQLDGDDDGALAEYRTALSLGPAEVVHNNIAVIDMKRTRWSAAEAELREELAVNPRFARAWHNLGIVLRHEQRSGEACAAATAAASLAPEDDAIEDERARDCAGL
jgi:tetratricopeptide (TPR) repeat protein